MTPLMEMPPLSRTVCPGTPQTAQKLPKERKLCPALLTVSTPGQAEGIITLRNYSALLSTTKTLVIPILSRTFPSFTS